MLKSLDERIELLTRAILDDAQADAAHAEEDARARAEEILQTAKGDAEKLRKEILDKAANEAAVIKDEQLAEQKMKAQMTWLTHREELLDAVFAEAEKRLSNLVDTPAYANVLLQLILEAVNHLQSDAVILHLDAVSRGQLTPQMIDEVSKATGAVITIGDNLPDGVGVVAETTDGHRQLNNTLSNRLHRQQDSLRAAVYHILMGEKA
ncbi:MAG: hypothetical protein HPY85_06430 [Anaerolineae bacterium]|nr:hypothetical protein [Anaerolineae bacterium]